MLKVVDVYNHINGNIVHKELRFDGDYSLTVDSVTNEVIEFDGVSVLSDSIIKSAVNFLGRPLKDWVEGKLINIYTKFDYINN